MRGAPSASVVGVYVIVGIGAPCGADGIGRRSVAVLLVEDEDDADG
jgi:hypothetical protein